MERVVLQKRTVITVIIFLLLISASGMGAVIYVDDNAVGDPAPGDPTISDPLEDGTSEHPFDAIQEAIDAAVDGDVIEVKDGTFTGQGNRDIDFEGKAITVRSEHGPASCIIDCQGSASDHHLGFFFHSGEGPDSVLDGFTITNGYHNEAGAILCMYVHISDLRGSNPTILNCVITNNWGKYAGAIYCKSLCEPLISNCIISENVGVYMGGINYSDECHPVLTNCVIRNNSSQHGGGIRTGGARCHGTITNCVISGNRGTNGGAGVKWWSFGGSVTITNCTIVANEDELWSGGIYIGGGGGTTGTITNCIIRENRVQGRLQDQISLWPDGDLPTTAEVTYCNVQGGWVGEGNIDADPLFVDADGTDDVLGTADDDFHLLGGSLCLDAGNNAAVPGWMTTDVEGNPRIVNGTVDLGAYEGPHQGLVVRPFSVSVGEGQTASFTVALGMDPGTSVEVTSVIVSGDPDITVVSGALLTFNSSNYSQYQTVTLAAAEDDDYLNGMALVLVGAPGFDAFLVSVAEKENENILYVDADAPGSEKGTSWPEAFGYLNDALAAAAANSHINEIRVAQGVYKPDQGAGQTPGDRGATFQLVNDVTLRGGYAGYGEPDPSARDINTFETILSGDLNGDDGPEFADNGENSYHIVTIIGTVVFDGFTVTGGNADGDYTVDPGGKAGKGGGVYCRGPGSPTLCNCTISGNSATAYYGWGGGMHITNHSRPTLTDCTFRDNKGGAGGGLNGAALALTNCTFIRNTASFHGGGMCLDGQPTLTNCTFSHNSSEGDGGGIFNVDTNEGPTLIDCTFNGNSAGGSGGGMYNDETITTLTNCTFTGNQAGEGDGGGVFNTDSSPTVTGCTFSENWASNNGGGMFNNYSRPTITNCIFSGNSADERGGGMYNYNYSSTTLINCTFSDNSAGSGGGIYNDYRSNSMLLNCVFSGNSTEFGGGGMVNDEWAEVLLTNCIFSGNSTNTSGGGMHNDDGSHTVLTNCTFSGNSAGSKGGAISCDSSCILEITNSILWGNTAGSEPQISPDGCSRTVIYSDVQGGWSGAGNIDADPLFADADGIDNVVGTEDDNLRLISGSPCIDAGDPDYVSDPGETDLDGNPRVVHNRIDMGAYEYQDPWIIYVDADAIGANDGSSWADAYMELQSALAEAGYGDQIWVAAGMYKPDYDPDSGTHTGDREATFQLENGVALYGGFPFVGGSWEDRDPNTYESILSGDLAGNDVAIAEPLDLSIDPSRAENSFHVVIGSGTDATAVLDGVTVTGGYAYGDFEWGDTRLFGGGMYNCSGSPSIANCTFRSNIAGPGGGMHNYWLSNPVVHNCRFIRNWSLWIPGADLGGAGMFNRRSSPTLTNCEFIENTVMGSNGGGMENCYNSNAVLTHCTFRGNSARNSGGIHNHSSNPTLTHCTFIKNSAKGGAGGMYNQAGSSPVVNHCIFTANSAAYGGGIDHVGGPSSLTNCVFNGNTVSMMGGGVLNTDSSLMLTNCIFVGNTAGQHGGGLTSRHHARSDLIHCTFTANAAPHGNALACDSRDHMYPSDVQVTNGILWDGANGIWNNDGSTITITYSDIQGGWEGEGNIDADPCFVQPMYLDPISYWKFDEGGGTTAYDSTGNHHGTIYGDTEWVPGKVGGALRFGDWDDYVRVEHDPALNITGDLTISAWVYITRGWEYQAIVTKCVGNGGWNNPFDFRTDYEPEPHLAFVRADAVAHERVYSKVKMPLGQWHHVLVRIENNVPDFYVNGILTGKYADTIFTRTPTGNTKPLLIGRRDNGLSFNGIIDEVMIFNRALLAEEIRALYHNDFSLFGDYHLRPDSPCIDAGADAGVYADMEGNLRPFDYPGVDNNGELPEFDMGAYEFVAVEADMKITPRTLNCRSHGKWIKANLVLPEDFDVSDVDVDTPARMEPLEIESDHMNVFVNKDGLVEIEAAFDREEFCETADVWPEEIIVFGSFTNGESFFGRARIRVIIPGLKDMAELTSRWLQTGCKQPLWCGGMDMNHDSVVDLKDFALLQNGCIEFGSSQENPGFPPPRE